MAFHRYHREMLEDFLTQHHANRDIVVRAMDGEDLPGLGFLGFFAHLCERLGIASHRITIISDAVCPGPWEWSSPPAVLFWTADQYVTDPEPLSSSARLMGITVGRFSPFRHRILKVLDQEFSQDIFMCCNYTHQEAEQFFLDRMVNAIDGELSWMHQRQLDLDLDLPSELRGEGTIPWPIACKSYSQLSTNFHIEIVVETDIYNPYWFTEKTSKCLITGKPFFLIAGTGSLKLLRDMGFRTLDGIIDESYDQAPTLCQRLEEICQQLHKLKKHPNQFQILADIQHRSQWNRQNWARIKQKRFPYAC